MNDGEKSSEKKKQTKIGTLKELVFTIAIWVGISFLIIHFFGFSTVDGTSMYPTLQNGDKLVLSLNSYKNHNPEYGDIIIIKRDDLSVKYLVKRVIGVPGDAIDIKNNELYINGHIIDEPYINEKMMTEDLSLVVPDGKLFVMGDNRNHSLDGRSPTVGLIDIDTQVYAKTLFDINKFKFL